MISKLTALQRPAALLGVAALLPIIVFAAAVTMWSLRQQSATLESEALERTRRLSDMVDRALLAQIDLVRALSELPLFEDDVDVRRFETAMERIHSQQPLWLTVTVLDDQGRRISGPGMPPGSAADPDSFRKAVETKAPVVGNLALGARNRWGLPIRAPVIRDGVVKYVVSVVIRPEAIAELLLREHLDPRWIGTVIDASGRVVARSGGDQNLLGQRGSAGALAARARGGEGSYPGRTLEGIETVSLYRMSPVTNWSVHIGIPRELYNAPLLRSLWLMVGAALVAATLAAVFAFLLGREIKSRRAEEVAIERSRRMEALGRLTGGVAHDFNNLLMVISGNLQILQRRYATAPMERHLQAILKATERGTQLTRDLLAFGRAGTAPSTPIDLNEQIRRSIGMIRQILPLTITIEFTADENLPLVDVDPVQLDLALLNLAVNARDSMPEGGVLRFATLTGRGANESKTTLSVSDTGGGIAAEHLPHVFEPFFTTKQTGKGSGLGLTQVYGFAKNAGGSVEAASQPGQGTTITVHLPASKRARELPPALVKSDAPVAGPRVLVVDDNDEIRNVTVEFLSDAGFAVVEAADAAAAIERLQAGSFAAVVTDIVMPGMDGIEFARRAKERWPGLHVVLMSGFSASIQQAASEGFTVLTKPFQLADLVARLRNLSAVTAAPAADRRENVVDLPTRSDRTS
jgi:signal transduction histidine kinase/ActR/RegA family two-component response regulator